MPTYEYRCDSCARNFDAVQSFHDDPLTSCRTCGSPVRKVFGNVGIVFKGSGFYKTDSRSGGKAKAATETSPETSGSESSGSERSGSEGSGSDSSGSESAPAAPAAKTSGDGATPSKAPDSNSSSPPTKAPAAAGSTSSKDSGS